MLAITNYNKVTVCLERPLLGHIPGNHKGLLFDGLQPGEGGIVGESGIGKFTALRLLLRALRKQLRDKWLLLVSHRTSTLTSCDRVIRLEDGRAVEVEIL